MNVKIDLVMNIYSGIKIKILVGFEPTTIGKCRHCKSSLTVPSQHRMMQVYRDRAHEQSLNM